MTSRLETLSFLAKKALMPNKNLSFAPAQQWNSRLFPLDWREHARLAEADGLVHVRDGMTSYHHPVATAFRIIADCQELRLQPAKASPQIAASLGALLALQKDDGSFRYPVEVKRYGLSPGWSSAMAQGLVISACREAEFWVPSADRARVQAAAAAAADHLLLPLGQGGCTFVGERGIFFEECPSTPPPHILNGACFAIIGLASSWRVQDRELAARAADDLLAGITSWDLGHWSRYDLHDKTPASLDYQVLHASLMDALHRLYPALSFNVVGQRFRSQAESRSGRARAFGALSVRRLWDVARGAR